MDKSNLKERALEILSAATSLSDELNQLGLPEPSFNNGLPNPLLRDASESDAGIAHQRLVQLLDELRALLTEPALLLTPELRNPLISVHSIVRLGIAENFPLHGPTVREISKLLTLRESLVRRLLAHCATHHIFYEETNDFFVHTAASRLLAESKGMREWILIGAEELIPATLQTANAIMKYPESEEPEHSGWSMHNATALPVFTALANMPDRATVFAGAMEWHAKLPGFSARYLASAFPWGAGDKVIAVDVGGGLGHVSQVLIEHNSRASCIVEDSPDVVVQGQESLPADSRNRISFKAHDFFQEQPVKGADIYLLRLVLHDWSDKYSKMIIKALIPALRQGTKVVVNDRVIPGRGETHYLAEREARDYDLYMLAFQNAKERSLDDWTQLFQDADPRFKLSSVSQPSKSFLAILDFIWEG